MRVFKKPRACSPPGACSDALVPAQVRGHSQQRPQWKPGVFTGARSQGAVSCTRPQASAQGGCVTVAGRQVPGHGGHGPGFAVMRCIYGGAEAAWQRAGAASTEGGEAKTLPHGDTCFSTAGPFPAPAGRKCGPQSWILQPVTSGPLFLLERQGPLQGRRELTSWDLRAHTHTHTHTHTRAPLRVPQAPAQTHA